MLATMLVLVVVGAVLAARWQGERAWKETRAELLAKGEKLDWSDFAPPPVPDAENFFADPVWEELEDYATSEAEANRRSGVAQAAGLRRIFESPVEEAETDRLKEKYHFRELSGYQPGTLLRTLFRELPTDPDFQRRAALCTLEVTGSMAPAMDKLRGLGRRPLARFPLSGGLPVRRFISYGYTVCSWAEIVCYRAWALAILGRNEEAAADLDLAFRLGDALSGEPRLDVIFYRLRILHVATGVLAAGMALHAWTDEQLAAFQRRLAALHLREDFDLAVRGQRAAANTWLASVESDRKRGEIVYRAVSGNPESISPPPWVFGLMALLFDLTGKNQQAIFNHLLQQWMEQPSRQSSALPRNELLDRRIANIRSSHLADMGHFLELVFLLRLASVEKYLAFVETDVREGIAACALERYFLRDGEYPEKLENVVPRFLPAVPLDPFDLSFLRFRRPAPQSFVLYAVGLDRIDGGGISGHSGSTGDVVWGEPVR